MTSTFGLTTAFTGPVGATGLTSPTGFAMSLVLVPTGVDATFATALVCCASDGGLTAGGVVGFPYMRANPMSVAATKSVEASAPHFVLRFQNNAAIITGDIAAKPEKANRTAISKMPCFSFK